jgi:hypothetical protein
MARLLEPSFTQGPNNIMGHACMLCLIYIYFKTCIDHTVVPLSEHRQPTRGERRMLDTSGARAPGREGKITKLNIVFAVYCAATQEKAWNMAYAIGNGQRASGTGRRPCHACTAVLLHPCYAGCPTTCVLRPRHELAPARCQKKQGKGGPAEAFTFTSHINDGDGEGTGARTVPGDR